jgi:hypothetical protein
VSYAAGDFRHVDVRIHRAGPIGDMHVPSFAIVTEAEWSESRDISLEDLAAKFEAEAKLIADVLIESLPGGTFDRLVGRLLACKASHFVVNHNTAQVGASSHS